MVLLSLAQRASILRFKTRIQKLLHAETSLRTDALRKLYESYIDFQNRMNFREVTPQEQGIELYSLIQEHMNISAELKALDAEISELHDYADLQEEKRRNDRLETISKIGAIFLPPTLVAGMLGMNIVDFSTSPVWASVRVAAIAASAWLGYRTLGTEKKRDAIRYAAR
jgi:Mg2+ and Co2+ transporter CorA